MDADFFRKGWGMRRWPVVVIAAVVSLSIRAPLVAHPGGAAFDTGVRVVLEGTVTVTEADGGSRKFEAGNTFYVPKGAQCSWICSESVMAIYATLDPDAG